MPFKKIYTTFHGYEGYPLSFRRILIHKISEKLSNGNICVGHAVAKWYKTKPTFTIYGGVDSKDVQKAAVNTNSAVFFGRLDPQTGVEQYIEIYKIIKKRFPKFGFKIYGEGKLKNKVSKDVHVFPFVKNTEEIISKNKYIFVSRYLSMLEALIQKRIVIAVYDNPIKKDYLLLSPFKKYIIYGKSTEDIAKKLTDIIENPKSAEEKIDSGYRWAKEQSWEKVVGIYERLWKT